MYGLAKRTQNGPGAPRPRPSTPSGGEPVITGRKSEREGERERAREGEREKEREWKGGLLCWNVCLCADAAYSLLT